jgi:drug/metabolite transporter (DMT)-like permease
MQMNRQFVHGLLAVLLAVVLWGAQFPVAKSAFATVDAFHVSAVRYGVGTLVLALLFAWKEGRAGFAYGRHLWPAMLFGVLGMCCSPLLVFYGLMSTRPEHVAIIVALQPSMTALADWVVRARRPANFTLACIGFAFAGVVLVVTKGQLSLDFGRGGWHDEMRGDLFVLLGTTCWVAYTMSTENFRGWSALRFTTLTLIPGTLAIFAVLPFVVAAGVARVPGVAELISVGWQLTYLAFAGVVLAMVCWNAGTQRVGALNAMLLLNFVPVVTFAVRFTEGERYVAAEMAGVAMVIGALAANNAYLRWRGARPRAA